MNESLILIVDDDPNILDGLQDILEDAGFKVMTAATGAAARAQVREQQPAVAFVDYQLPDGTGLAVAADIRHEAPQAAIFLMTGMSAEEIGHSADGIVNDVLTKPVDPARVIALLRKTLGLL